MSALRILIIEDEKPAAEKLERLLKEHNNEHTISGPIDSISESIKYLEQNLNSIDLIFLDIQLTDGVSFQIFEQVTINKPVIFTTAYNEYALEAFKINSIDYLLKPFDYQDIKKAFDKFFSFKESFAENNQQPTFDLETLKNLVENKSSFKSRFIVRKGEKIKAIESNDIKLFYADDRDVYLLSSDNRRYSINQKLEEIEKQTDPSKFFRVSRTYLVQFRAINEIIAYSNSRLKLDVEYKLDKEIIVSRDKVSAFKKWIEGE